MSTTTRAPVALVTGGRRGIGRGCAYALAEAGWDVVIDDKEHDADVEETLNGIAARGRRAKFILADISNVDAHASLVEDTVSAFGAIDCLVNNAGVTVLKRGDMLETTPESWDHVLGTNTRGTFFLTQRVANWMLDNPTKAGDPHRSIIMISSVNAEVMAIGRAEYCVSKAGIAMMVKLFGIRLAEHGIQTYDVRPGIIRTPMTAPVTAKYDAAIAEGISPIRRWGEVEDCGKAVATLASGAIPFSVGQEIRIDGGLTWRHF